MITPASDPPHAAEWRAVSKRFGGNSPQTAPALDHFDLAVRAGEFLTLLGPSGCGKTTALRLLSGLETPDSGQILLDGADVTALPPHRRHVNQVFQSYALFPHLSVADNIAFGLRMQRLPSSEIRTRIAHAAELLALDGLLARRPDALSGGQRQRVALARALVCQPRVLLLDEPLSALDARLRAQVRGELRALQRRLGTTFVFVTHDQEEALTLSDRVAVMQAGRLEQIGTPQEVYHRPRSRFVASFIGEANLLDAEITGLAEGAWNCRLVAGAGEYTLRAKSEISALPLPRQVALLIRPEHVRLTLEPAPDAPGQGGFTVLTEERVFRGADTMFTLRLSAARHPDSSTGSAAVRLRALVPSGLAGEFPPGGLARANVDPAQVIVLP